MHRMISGFEGMGLGCQLGTWLAGRVVLWTTGQPDHLADRLVGDIDRDIDDMRLITRHDAGPAALLPERLALLGVDAAALERDEPRLVAELEANCRACPHWRRCARDVAQGAGAADDYCANARRLVGRA